MANPQRPSAIWGGSANLPGESSNIGCVFCAYEEVVAPVSVFYMFSGTSYCKRHLTEKVFNAQAGGTT